jgi:hypothetical protein
MGIPTANLVELPKHSLNPRSTTMTDDKMALRELLEKGSGPLPLITSLKIFRLSQGRNACFYEDLVLPLSSRCWC